MIGLTLAPFLAGIVCGVLMNQSGEFMIKRAWYVWGVTVALAAIYYVAIHLLNYPLSSPLMVFSLLLHLFFGFMTGLIAVSLYWKNYG